MNKNISEEVIEIGGQEYTLFINRAGIVSWEKVSKISEKKEKYSKYHSVLNEDVEINDDTNPFELCEISDIDESMDDIEEMYAKFYWIALYTHHKLTVEKAREIYNIALEEYGIEQLALLAQQMIESINEDKITKNLKNLKALKPTK